MLPTPARILADALAPAVARWSVAREREILLHGTTLSDRLVDFAADLGIERPDALRLELTGVVPVPVPAPLVNLGRRFGLPLFHPVGMALGRGISAITDEPGLLRHELVHVLQYQRAGGHLPFMGRYLFECLHHGYAAAPLEIEARERSAKH